MRTKNIRDGVNSQLMPDNMTFRFGEYATLPTCNAGRKNHVGVQDGSLWFCDGTSWSTSANGAQGFTILTASVADNPPDTANAGYHQTTITVTGAAVGDLAVCSHSTINPIGGWMNVGNVVSATNTVRASYQNVTGGNSNPGAGTLRCMVFKP